MALSPCNYWLNIISQLAKIIPPVWSWWITPKWSVVERQHFRKPCQYCDESPKCLEYMLINSCLWFRDWESEIPSCWCSSPSQLNWPNKTQWFIQIELYLLAEMNQISDIIRKNFCIVFIFDNTKKRWKLLTNVVIYSYWMTMPITYIQGIQGTSY